MKNIFALAVLTLLSSISVAQDVRYNFDKNTDFLKLKTYKWVPIKDAAKVSDLVDKQIKDAIDAELATKGLSKVEGDDANLYVGYQAAVGEEKQFNSYSTGWGYGPGWGGGWYGGGMGSTTTTGSTSTIYKGQLALDMFSVVNGVLLSPFPFSDPDRLVTIKNQIPKLGPTAFSVPAPDVLTYQRETKSFTDVAGYQESTYDLTGRGAPRKVQGARLTSNVLSVLGAEPMLGRNFTPDEDRIGKEKVVILSYRIWRGLFGSDPNVLDQTVTLDRNPYTVIGVMGKDFIFPIETQLDPSELWVPMAFTEGERKSVGDNFDYNIVARLKPGVSLVQARSDVERVAQIIREGYPAAVKSQFEVHGVVMAVPNRAIMNIDRMAVFLTRSSV